MYEEAQEIFEYLPIRKSTIEEDYIEYLWNAFLMLDGGDAYSRPFALMPFHLLFMLALQYKVLRVSQNKVDDYTIAFTMESRITSEQKGPHNPESVFDLALLPESKIIDLLKLIGLEQDIVKTIKELIRNRNDNLAHAKGGIDPNPEGKIELYIGALRSLQPQMILLNNTIADEWLQVLTSEDDLNEFVEGRLLDSYLCPADMQQGKLAGLDQRINGF